jgi:hypothetical protein
MLRNRVAYLMLGMAVTVVVTTAQTPATQRGAEPAPGTASPSFSKDVLPILQNNCQSCHRPGQIGPMPLLEYEQVRPWARAIKARVADRTMPPWHADSRYGHFVNDRSLKQSEIDTVLRWVDEGARQGDPKDAPPAVRWPPQGWQVQPDVVVTLPAYEVPASGTIEWENIAVRSPFDKDTWITSIEILPSDHATVHHMCFAFQKPRPEVVHNQYEWAEIARDEHQAAVRPQAAGVAGAPAPAAPQRRDAWILTRDVGSTEVKRRLGRPILMVGGSNCYVPGMSLHDYRAYEAGQLVPGGSDMVFNLHYQTVGKAVTNSVKIGFTLAKAPLKKKFVQLVPGDIGATLAIPPNEPNYAAPPAEVQIKKDVELVWLSPHMHFRGKDMTWSLTYPDGRKEIILSVPRFQYNWQLQYQTRVKVPAGTMLRVEAHYDNSAGNRFNPNPNTWVYRGNQAWEEMMSPFTWLVVDTEVDERELTDRPARADGA